MAKKKGCDGGKLFRQDEVNRIISVRLKRERDQLADQMKKNLDDCLIHLQESLLREMEKLKRSIHTETNGSLKPRE